MRCARSCALVSNAGAGNSCEQPREKYPEPDQLEGGHRPNQPAHTVSAQPPQQTCPTQQSIKGPVNHPLLHEGAVQKMMKNPSSLLTHHTHT